MTGLLHGKVAAVTGAARGIGLAVTRRFAAAGASVALADIDLETAEVEAARLAFGGSRAIAVKLDVSSEESVESCIAAIQDQLGIVDCAVANAGILHLAHVADMTLDAWRRVLDVNLTGAFLTARGFARAMLASGNGGRILFTSSLLGLRGGPENGAYSASKFGVVGLMQCLAAELAPHGVLVNAVCPGQIDTEMIAAFLRDRAGLRGTTEAEVASELQSRVPLGRMGTADEVGDVFVYLASDLARYVTGQSLVVDGGWQVG